MKKIKRFFLIAICIFLLTLVASEWIPTAHAASSMTASKSCIEFIKTFEGFSAKPYGDYNQYTVGYGTKCPDEKYNDYLSNGISRSEAESLLLKELTDIEDTINKKLIDKYNLTLAQHQYDALVSFSFNIGTNWMTYDSTLRQALTKNADENDLVYAFGLYCTAGGKYSPGLVTRRLCEANLFLNGVYSKNRPADYGYVYYDANGGTVTYRVQAFVCENNTAPALNAVRNEDVFLGWYTDLTGGTQVSSLSSALTGKTLFARWQSSETIENQNAKTVVVTGDAVNIRSGPGTNYKILRRVYRNDIISVSHITHLTNMKWGKIKDGWICLDYTNYDAGMEDAVPDADASADVQNSVSGIVKVNDFLRIRSGPGTTYSTVGFLFDGNKIEILEQKSTASAVWGRISNGWVCMDYIITHRTEDDTEIESGTKQEQDKEPAHNITDSVSKTESTAIKGKITADALRIRSAPGTTNSIVGHYYQNESVFISEKAQVGVIYWGKTNKGWICMNYVLPESSADESTQPSGDDKKTIHADCLRIRKEPGTDQKIVGFLFDGDTVTILETKTIDGTAWGRIDKGWICMKYAY